jgi:hypothetical protein
MSWPAAVAESELTGSCTSTTTRTGGPTWKACCWPALPQLQGKQLIGVLSSSGRLASQLADGGHSVRRQSRARTHSSIPCPGSCNSRQHGEPARNGVSVVTKDFPPEWRKLQVVDGFTLNGQFSNQSLIRVFLFLLPPLWHSVCSLIHASAFISQSCWSTGLPRLLQAHSAC